MLVNLQTRQPVLRHCYLLPAQNTHTLHYPIRDTEHARAGGVEDGLGVGGLDGGGDGGNVVREEAACGGCAALAVSRVVGGAGEARLAREEAEDGHERGCERAGGQRVGRRRRLWRGRRLTARCTRRVSRKGVP